MGAWDGFFWRIYAHFVFSGRFYVVLVRFRVVLVQICNLSKKGRLPGKVEKTEDKNKEAPEKRHEERFI